MKSPLESVIAQAWKSVAGAREFRAPDVTDSDPERSDRLTEFASTLRSVFAIDIHPETISAHESIEDLARFVAGSRGAADGGVPHPGGAPAPDRPSGPPPASFGQSGFWYVDQYSANPSIYNAPIVLKPDFAVDPALLEQSLLCAVARHEALRTTFRTTGGELVQHIADEPRVDFSIRRFTGEEEYEGILRGVMDPPFDLANGPLLRVVCAVDDRQRTRVMCNVHHIVFDATSVGLLLDDWFSAYVRLRDGLPTGDAPAPGQYQDFARWQRNHLDPRSLDRLLEYWQRKLAGPLPLLDLPLDKLRPAVRTHAGNIGRFRVPAALTDRLRKRSAHEDVTLFMLLLSAYAVFLHKYTRQSDLLIGSPASLRDTPETHDVIGYLVNMIVLRCRLDDRLTLKELHRAVKEEVVTSLQHKHAPLEKVIERVRPARSTGHPPVFQTMFVMPHADAELFDRLGLDMDVELYATRSSKYDLSLIIEDGSGGTDGGTDSGAGKGELSAIFEYDSGLFDDSTVEAMGVQFLHILEQFVETPDTTLGRIRLLDDDRERALLEHCTGKPPATKPRPVMELFRRQVERTPDAVALGYQDRSTTYRELDDRANRLARLLRSRGITAGSRVGILLKRSPEMIVALLGVLKSGAAYVPIDPAYPPDRIAYALRDSRVRLVITETESNDRIPDLADLELLDLDRETRAIDAFESTDPGPVKDPTDEIYVVYTSGSTGSPKGVVIADATISNLIEHQIDISAVGAGARTLQYMSLAFDVSIQEILGTLCAGGTLVLIPEELQKDLHRLAEFMARERIARAYFPYIALQQLVAVSIGAGLRLDALREAVSVGEQLVISPQIRDFFTAHPRARLWNMYGPSETHLASTHRLDGDPATWGGTAAIGRPIPGFAMVALDAAGNMVPPGVPGELYIGGDLISPGYNRLPDETASRFGVHPIAGTAGERMYRTGDLVRINGEGDFEYLGRTDDQIKIRGYRIEPAEVEAALDSLDFVDASAVAAVRFDDGDTRLVAYLAAPERADDDVLRQFLRPVLPDYMVPSHFVHLDAIPTTPSGKIDRKALPDLFRPTTAGSTSTPVSTPTEREVARRWRVLLKNDDIGAHDDFFAMGGHSIMATGLVYELRTHFGIDIALRVLLDHPTVAGMAASIDALVTPGAGPAPVRPTLNLRADIGLPAHVDIPEQYRRDEDYGRRRTVGARNVLLTGATGFLGTYLLRDLLERTDARVHCLVRAASHQQARRRLRDTARGYRLDHLDHADHDARVVTVLGDLATDRLGLDDQAYRALTDVDAVYHAAAHINFVAPYASVKSTNVAGMTRIIEFCADGEPKPLHYASTIAVFSPNEDQGVITETTVPRDEQNLGIGYTQSKWVAEHLALTARERGLPVTVYRMGRIAGDSTSGACQPDDFLWRQIKSFVQLGSAPPGAQMRTDLLPVDFVSRALVQLSLQAGPDETFHLFHPDGADFEVVHAAIRNAGHPLDVVSPDAWFAALEESAAGPEGNALAATIPLFQEGALELGDNIYGNDATTRSLKGLGLEYPAIDVAAISRMIEYFRGIGEID